MGIFNKIFNNETNNNQQNNKEVERLSKKYNIDYTKNIWCECKYEININNDFIKKPRHATKKAYLIIGDYAFYYALKNGKSITKVYYFNIINIDYNNPNKTIINIKGGVQLILKNINETNTNLLVNNYNNCINTMNNPKSTEDIQKNLEKIMEKSEDQNLNYDYFKSQINNLKGRAEEIQAKKVKIFSECSQYIKEKIFVSNPDKDVRLYLSITTSTDKALLFRTMIDDLLNEIFDINAPINSVNATLYYTNLYLIGILNHEELDIINSTITITRKDIKLR